MKLILFIVMLVIAIEYGFRILTKDSSKRRKFKFGNSAQWMKKFRFDNQANWMNMEISELHEIMAKASGVDTDIIEQVYSGDDAIEKYDYRPFIGFHFKPNQKLTYTEIDKYGFQSRIDDFRKAANVKRVLVFGGSAAYGIGTTCKNNVWTTILEEKLNEISKKEGKNLKWEVVNMAYVASTSHSELNRLIMYGKLFNPDYVIQLSGFNDLYWFLQTRKLYTFNFYNTIYKLIEGSMFVPILKYMVYNFAILRFFYEKLTKNMPGNFKSYSGKKLDKDMIYTVW